MRRGSNGARSSRRSGWVLVVASLVLATGACSSDDGASPPESTTGSEDGPVTVSVTPENSGIADPLAIAITGLDPDAEAVLEVTSTDSQGLGWASSTTYRADGSGTLDLAAAPSVDRSDPDPMAPISSMRPTDLDAETPGYFWSGDLQAFTVSVLVGDEEVVSAEVQRGEPLGALADTTTVADDGFMGQLWMPPDSVEVRSPAIVNLGGSEGGLRGGLKGGALAAEGHPVLDVAYFNGDFLDAPGLPAELADIPLEYFTGAIEWLGARPEVDPEQIWVMGGSRGSEAALLLGAEFPDLVAGVIALAPSNVVLCRVDCTGPAWTLDGTPVPFTSQLKEPAPTDVPEAVIPVEQIDGPVLAVCGEQDELWPACDYSEAMNARLDETDFPHPHEVIVEPDAGHSMASLVPYQPQPPGGDPDLVGLSETADQAALGRVWPQVLDFLATNGQG